jgi:hypothetical protein
MDSKVKAKRILEEREQTSEQEKPLRAIISIVALKTWSRALAKSETRSCCGLGSQFWSSEPVSAPSIPLTRSLLWQLHQG